MKPLDDMLPEENEPQYKELIKLVQDASPRFASIPLERQQQILSRVRTRLMQANLETTSTEEMPAFTTGRLSPPLSKTGARASKQYRIWWRVRLFNEFAAVLVVAMLLVTAWLIFGPWSPLQVVGNRPDITLPSINPNQSAIASVPNLMGLSYQEASTEATQAGFKLQSQNGSQAGVVILQSPPSNDMALKGSTIIVEMGQLTSTPIIKVPSHLVGNTLAVAEQILKNVNIPYTVVSAGQDPSQGSNIVKSVNPPENSSLQPGQKVTLYVVNLTNGTPTAAPTPLPTPNVTPAHRSVNHSASSSTIVGVALKRLDAESFRVEEFR